MIEMLLPWNFDEDKCRIRSGKSPHNFSLLRRLALNMLRLENTWSS